MIHILIKPYLEGLRFPSICFPIVQLKITNNQYATSKQEAIKANELGSTVMYETQMERL